MKKRTQLITILIEIFLLQSLMSNAQSISPIVYPSCGGFYIAGNNSLSWTVGETFPKTLQGGNKMLTQGFQQPYILVKILRLKTFIEGFYSGSGQMSAVLYNNGMSLNSNACDSITVELHSASLPFSLVQSANGLLLTDGNALIQFPPTLKYGSYYVVIRLHNTIETWSKNPVDRKSVV